MTHTCAIHPRYKGIRKPSPRRRMTDKDALCTCERVYAERHHTPYVTWGPYEPSTGGRWT